MTLRVDLKKKLFDFSKEQPGCNLVHRHMTKSCKDLDTIDELEPSKKRLRLDGHDKEVRFICYPCGRRCRLLHPVYIYSCYDCGEVFSKLRYLTRDLTGHVALVTGARSKLGHQIVLKLLRAGCTVFGLTRYPVRAIELFSGYEDAFTWKNRLHWVECDLDCDNLTEKIKVVMHDIEKSFGFLSILINNAAQTIRVREKNIIATDSVQPNNNNTSVPSSSAQDSDQLKNRYGDGRSVPVTLKNSWQQRLIDTEECEHLECYRVNALAPTILCNLSNELMQKSPLPPYIINVHAREGMMNVKKSALHVHTNMAKAALHMLTKGLVAQKYKTKNGIFFSVHGCDPGWISVDEYYTDKFPCPCAPLDERDGAARILYPIFAQLTSCSVTRRHFNVLEH